MSNINPWEDIYVPDNILESIKRSYVRNDNLRMTENRTNYFILCIPITIIILIIFLLTSDKNSRDAAAWLGAFGITLILSTILHFIFFHKYKPDEDNTIKQEVNNYKKCEFEKQQEEIRLRARKDRSEKNREIAKEVLNDFQTISDFIFLIPFLSYRNWLKSDEWHARGKLKIIFERQGFKVEFYNYKSLLLEQYRLVKYNNGATKPSISTLKKFLREKIVLNLDDTEFISVEECSENAKNLAESNDIRIFTLKEFILLLPDRFGMNPVWSEGIRLKCGRTIIHFFETGKKNSLLKGFETIINQLKIELQLISGKLDNYYYEELDKEILGLGTQFIKAIGVIDDEAALGEMDYYHL